MKKLLSSILTLTLIFSLCAAFSGCQWDAGGGSAFTPTDEWIAAAAAYNAKLDEVEAAIANEADYTKSSREALKVAYEALPTFKTAGHTPEEIATATETLNALFENLVTPDQAIDERINNAISKLKLYITYGETYNGVTYYANASHPTGTPVYFKMVDGEPKKCEKDDEGAYVVANKGVDSISYNNETNSAIFNLSDGYENMKLISFIDTDVLAVFDKDFNDLTEIKFNVNVYASAEATEKTSETIVMNAETSSGMYLGAGLIAICAGLEQELYDMFVTGNMSGFNDLLRTMKAQTFELVAGKSCSASVTFSNSEYTKTTEFAVAFSM